MTGPRGMNKYLSERGFSVIRKTMPVTFCLLALAFGNRVYGQGLPERKPPLATPSQYVPSLTFDVASVRQSKPTGYFIVGGENPSNAGILILTNVTLESLIERAYDVQPFQMNGGTAWLDVTTFDVRARCDDATENILTHLNAEQATLEKQHMLQELLADRFKLQVHMVTRELPALSLTVLPGRPNFSRPKANEETADSENESTRSEKRSIYESGDGRLGYEFIAHGASMKSLATELSTELDTTVIDETGLSESYDFTLKFNSSPQNERNRDPALWPPIRDAIQDQLGLKLKPAKAPAEIIYIDHAEMPSEN